jgi:hypothetical protein
MHVLMQMDGRIETDAYEGMEGKMPTRPPKWAFRWDAEGKRLPVEVKSS